MINSNLLLDVGSNIRLNEIEFTVDGYIVFKDSDGTKWIEYKLKAKRGFQVQWLSVDKVNDEYAVYSEESYSEEFLEENIKANGYKEVDNSSAKVVDYRGNVDVDLGEKVFYKEYEDSTEELLISIENWDGEQEFSKGYYIDKNDIEKLDSEFNNKYDIDTNESNELEKDKGNAGAIVGIILVIITVIISLRACGSNKQDKSLSRFIESNSNFQYETSITSDLDQKKKANVYSTSKTIEEAAKLLIEGLKGNIEDVQENKEDSTVAIMTKDEMALIYLSDNSRTLIQVSLREYVYSSRNTVYRGSHRTNRFYRSYYYNRGYNKDKSRYSNSPNGYSDYNDGSFTPNDSNRYKTYSNSIRQSSVNTRSSSGDGISSGK
ncbi:DUF4178 domain-containing protein [Clostridium peptidivorans]|uniref:DUF4178 domain-containing protein n=1 Tax=Clostridium peptidivorans TaxID=100174 RepID=UPI000BE34E00|nr:DUF4178 domain-containing protein [Clostridium peptidivorans]